MKIYLYKTHEGSWDWAHKATSADVEVEISEFEYQKLLNLDLEDVEMD